MKNLFVLLAALFFATTIQAQHHTEWVGGFPGQPNNWNCPKNWSTHKVPDSFDDVVIPDLSSTTMSYPIINSEVEPIGSLTIASPASLTLTKNGTLEIGVETENSALILGMINNDGTLKLNMPFVNEDIDVRKNISGNGTVIAFPVETDWVNANQ